MRLSRTAIALLLSLPSCSLALADDFRLVSQEGRMSEYEGRLSLSGRFERRQDAETLVWRGDRICFFPEAAARARLPGATGANAQGEPRFFCFSNHNAAARQFRLAALPPAGSCGVAGQATVVISKYTVEADNLFDQAWLESVAMLGETAPLACP